MKYRVNVIKCDLNFSKAAVSFCCTFSILFLTTDGFKQCENNIRIVHDLKLCKLLEKSFCHVSLMTK